MSVQKANMLLFSRKQVALELNAKLSFTEERVNRLSSIHLFL